MSANLGAPKAALEDCPYCGGSGKRPAPPAPGPRIFIEMHAYPIVPGQVSTGTQLREMHPGYPPTDDLWLEHKGIGFDDRIELDTEVALEDGQKFYYIPRDITQG